MSDTVWSTRRLLRQSGLILFLLLICPLLAWACKYSVRDVGFVALDSHSYQLQLIVSSETSETLKEKLHSEYAPLLRDTNIELEVLRENSEILSTSQTEQKPDSGKTAAWLIDTFPASSEESESSFPRRLFLEQVPVEDKATLSAFLWELSDSELREKLIAGTLKAHSVLLIIEGTNTEHNELARKLASQASDQVKSELPDLPKPVEFPPEVITLSVNDRETERILLWSWNIDPEDKDQTYLVPLFGRGRILGEPLAVPGISLTELSTILSYVGQDCECELDRSWMQGKMFPHRWDEHQETVVAKALDFDPGSSLVKSEITRILARGPNGRRNLGVGEATEGDLINLTQTEPSDVSEEEANDILRELNILTEQKAEPIETTEVAEQSTASSDEESVAEKSTSHDEEMVLPQSIQTPLEIGGIVAIILVLLMLFRGRRLQKD